MVSMTICFNSNLLAKRGVSFEALVARIQVKTSQFK